MFMAFGVLMWLLVWFFSYPAHATTISRYLGRIIGSQCCTVQDRFWVAQESSTTGCSCKYGLDLFVVYCLLGGNYDDIYIYIYILFMDTWCVSHSRDGRFTSITEDLFEKIAAECLNLCSKTNGMSNDDLGKTNFDEGNVKPAGYQRGTIPLHGFDRSLQ